MALLIMITGFLNISCFIIGAKVGQAVSKDEKVLLPDLNPLKGVKESRARKEVEKEQEKINTILRNIERYDGTSKGQEEVM